MDIDKQIEIAMTRALKIWVYLTLIAFCYVLYAFPWWAALIFAACSYVSYYLTMIVTGVMLGLKISQQDLELDVRKKHARELNKRLFGSEATDEELEHEGIQMGSVVARSPDIIGFFADTPIYDWVEVMDPHTGKVERFNFSQRAQRQGDDFIIPNEEGKIFVLLDGLIYERST